MSAEQSTPSVPVVGTPEPDWSGYGTRQQMRAQIVEMRRVILARCFMCERGIPRREIEPFDSHTTRVSGLHSWRGNDRMWCGISTEEARACGL